MTLTDLRPPPVVRRQGVKPLRRYAFRAGQAAQHLSTVNPFACLYVVNAFRLFVSQWDDDPFMHDMLWHHYRDGLGEVDTAIDDALPFATMIQREATTHAR